MRLLAVCLAAFHLGGCQAAPRIGSPYHQIASTGSVQEQRVAAGHTVQVVMVGNGHAIVVDGRILARDIQDDHVVIKGVYEGSGHAYVLVEEQSGGIACPSLFQTVDVSGAVPVVSPQFGDCSDVPRVSVVGGALVVAVPTFQAAPAARVTFKDGHR